MLGYFGSKPRGFSIIEIVWVLGLAMILMALAIPNFLSLLPSLRLSSAARQVAQDLQVARMKAISQNQSYTVDFDPPNGTYTYGSDSRNIKTEYPGITIQSVSPQDPQFSPRGTATATATITLSNGAAQKWICVKTVGRVNIQDSDCT
jgi:Tfp pilus assembly protein FimT